MCVRDNERSLMSPVFFFLIKIFLIRVAEEKVLTKQNLVSSFFMDIYKLKILIDKLDMILHIWVMSWDFHNSIDLRKRCF